MCGTRFSTDGSVLKILKAVGPKWFDNANFISPRTCVFDSCLDGHAKILIERRDMSPDLMPLPQHMHDDVIKWKHFPRYWLFVRGIHRSKASDRKL